MADQESYPPGPATGGRRWNSGSGTSTAVANGPSWAGSLDYTSLNAEAAGAANLAALNGPPVVPGFPVTRWPVGAFLTLSGGTLVFWDGAKWVAGKAVAAGPGPAPEPDVAEPEPDVVEDDAPADEPCDEPDLEDDVDVDVDAEDD